MGVKFKTVHESEVLFAELMLPSNSNFSGKIHGGFILSLMDKIAFACASKHSSQYCVTASVDTVDFLQPINVGELVSMKACINYVGRSSMVVGIRVESENIQTGEKKHCNSSYFTMVAKNSSGNNVEVPGLIVKSKNEKRRFLKALHRISDRKSKTGEFKASTFDISKHLSDFEGQKVQLAN